MSWFWQKTQRRLQPLMKTAPLPLCPCIHGSVIRGKIDPSALCNLKSAVREPKPTFAEMRSYDIDLGLVSDKAHARRLITVNATQTGTKIAIPKMGVRLGALQGSITSAQRLIARHVAVEQKRRCQMQLPLLGPDPRRLSGNRICETGRAHEMGHVDKFTIGALAVSRAVPPSGPS